ncbi:two-component system response regulator PilR (NtrC family) [Natronospira proteinivora]|uniref:Two-component system response regulator PilR (NtrC family) n=1 Tax=Natronospira proteinivora TaxID=1807133 RepID=A0ABT1G4B2_9GAMM|nr:sigma-54 dependent transcriptional regulator [Natronospira proteinivora]MCP1726125.1 two-component system response regulator PilR (NtrC family) [Natronospira proteinivora]
MSSKPRALIVDDEPDILELLGMTLARMSVDSVATADLAEANRALEAGHFDLCLTDMRLPDGDGMSLVRWITDHRPQLPVAVITAHGNVEAAVAALKAGAFDFVSKPVDLQELRALITTALKLRETGDDRRKEDPDSELARSRLTGDSPEMRQLRQLIGRVARSQAPVLISGESGTGKELVARLIHDSGPRASAPFVPVNCGAIPAELMESELFGHRKGSFTGATADREGLFQAAEGGTLFLDEVAELPLAMQVKLLRVIQERSVRPVGGREEIPVDVRILSATHRNLAEAVQAGEFREDIFYRLNVIELPVPSLRQRREDLPGLIEDILANLACRLDMPQPRLSDAALEKLQSHPFPGNVRELENMLERAITLSDGGQIEAADIFIKTPTQPANGGEGELSLPPDNGQPLPDFLEDMEREAIQRALERCRFNKTEAARTLGMTFRQLRYRIKKLDLD